MEELIKKSDWELYQSKILGDLCSMYTELEYFKKRIDSSKIVILQGKNVDAQKVVDTLEQTIPVLREKLEIINKFLEKYESK